jgi:hypothetical protein
MVVKSLSLFLAATAAFLVLSGLLVWVVARFLRSNREQLVASGPLAAAQEFALREPSALVLLVEVPRFGSDFRQLEFEVVEQATGQSTRMRYDFVRAQGAVYGVTTMRVPLGRITVQRPGSYLLRTDDSSPARIIHAAGSCSLALPRTHDRRLLGSCFARRHVVKSAPRFVAGLAAAARMSRPRSMVILCSLCISRHAKRRSHKCGGR